MNEYSLKDAINRRNFLMLCCLGAIGSSLAACGTSSPPQNQETATPTSTNTPTPTTPPVATENDWNDLAHNLEGSLIRANSNEYETAHQLFSPLFDSVKPQAIIYAASTKDVQTSLTFARRFTLPLVSRAGGHSFAGYSTSTGIMLDLTRINGVTVDTNARTATIGGGARLIDIYAKLADDNLTIPAGSCPTVGVAGLALGGGIGVIGRKFGLTCDNLLSAEVVLADSRSLTCDKNQNADLYWALRGGGGGNFGVVTSFTFQAHQVNNLALFTFSWPWQSAVNVVNGWQQWMSQMPAELWSNCVLISPPQKGNSPRVQINGVYVGDVNTLGPMLQQLINQVGTQPSGRYASNASIMETMMYEAGCSDKSLEQCHLPTQNANGLLQRDLSRVKSDYVTKLLPQAAIEVLVNAISQRYASSVLGDGGIGMDSYGGAINQVAADATAFSHRDALFSIQYSASWHADDSEDTANANHTWLTDTWQAMRSYVTGTSYQNYMDPDLPDWLHAYYGNNLTRLQQIKTQYDPTNFFHFQQSIPLA